MPHNRRVRVRVRGTVFPSDNVRPLRIARREVSRHAAGFRLGVVHSHLDFDFSENWQLAINADVIIVTFLMVFIIRQSPNKDSVALDLKPNELLAAGKQASNRMIEIEELDEPDLREVAQSYKRPRCGA